MYRRKAFYRLDLDNHTVGHHEVDTISTIELQALVHDRQRYLHSERNLTQAEFITETLDIGRFQQAWAKGAVHLDRGSDNGLGDFVDVDLMSLSWRPRLSVFSAAPRLCG
jgi:hypothetical protein